jgi:regulator of sigma E protease
LFLMDLVVKILAFIGILGSAVVLHEFGHFIVAKLFKIRVETFSAGFGPRLFGKKWGDTDYRVSLIPLGGYVKLGGDESNAAIEGGGATDIPEAERFNLRPRWQRILVAVAGPVMNVLTALSIPFAAALIYGVPATPSPVVSYITSGGAAEVAGLKLGDRIVAFNGIDNPKWDIIRGDALLSPDQPLPLVVERNGQRVSLTIKPTAHTEDGETAGYLDFIPDYGGLPVVLHDVMVNSPASRAGLQPGDRILTMNGQSIRSAEEVSQYVREHKGQPITLAIERGGRRSEITATAARLADGSEKLGITPTEEIPLRKANLSLAGRHAIDSNIEIMRLTGKALGQVFAGKRSVRNTLSGPIGIYQAAAKSVDLGWDAVFGMLGFLSLNLGVFNLLPIPVLDGGAIFLLLIEGCLGLIGMSLSLTVRDRIQQVGFVMVILLMLFVLTNDVLKRVSPDKPDTRPSPAAPAK